MAQQPHPEQNAVPEGYEGYVPPSAQPAAAQPYASAQYQAGQQAYQQQQPYQQQGHPAVPQQHYPGQDPQMQQQPMPAPVYGYPQPKSKITAGLLGIFLGGLGIHRFYLGHTKIGVIQLLLTVFMGLFTFGLVGLWGFVEGIMIIAGSASFRTDARGVQLRD